MFLQAKSILKIGECDHLYCHPMKQTLEVGEQTIWSLDTQGLGEARETWLACIGSSMG